MTANSPVERFVIERTASIGTLLGPPVITIRIFKDLKFATILASG
jgi:hypothetical protein